MKISWNWVQDWVSLDGIEPQQLADRLTMAGLEVEGIEKKWADSPDIVVGKILEIDDHPNADKLVRCKVSDGSDTLSIVCGADNMEAGDFVPLAVEGSSPPGVDFEIVSREVRGEPSEGMLCSQAELELAESSEGLWILPEGVSDSVGEPVFDVMGLADTVFEFDLTPNRSDCLSHLGVAREVAALYDRELEYDDKGLDTRAWEDSTSRSIAELANLDVESPDRSPGYLCAVLEDIDVDSSPWEIRRRLASIGVRRVNNIVDATNFVLFDVGQPLHAFDLDELNEQTIRVRQAEDGEQIEGIDHETYELDEDDLVIADAERPVAIAGVMGGAKTEVSEKTDRILLECAYFQPESVRRTSSRHKIHTDSSHRFERGIDSGGLESYLSRAIDLLLDTSPNASVASDILDHRQDGLDATQTVHLDKEDVESLLGLSFSRDEIASLLESIELDVETEDGELAVTVPTHRPDLTRPADIIEEVARLEGYDRIESSLPTKTMGDTLAERPRDNSDIEKTIETPKKRRVESKLRQQGLDAGLREAVNGSFVSEVQGDVFHLDSDWKESAIKVSNPLVAKKCWLRQSLLPGLVENAKLNQNHGTDDIALFEFGRRCFDDEERPTFGMFAANRRVQHWSGDRDWDFYDVKGVIEDLCQQFAIDDEAGWEPVDKDFTFLHPGVAARLSNGDTTFAYAGQLHPEVADQFELSGEPLVAEVLLDNCFAVGFERSTFQSISRYPSVERDFALVYDKESLSYAHIEDAIDEVSANQPEVFGHLLEGYELFDLYEGEQLAGGERSIALSVTYRSDSGTLTDEQVAEADAALTDWLSDRLDIRQR
jgi:phenylalanyl-tRNA synthetase beta chain